MKTYRNKKTGVEVQAFQMTKEKFQELASKEKNIFETNRVSENLSWIIYRGASGKIGDWFVIGGDNLKSFFESASFESNFERLPISEPTEQELNLDFETDLKNLIANHMPRGLTVTGAVGTLHLCAADIANQFFNQQTTFQNGDN